MWKNPNKKQLQNTPTKNSLKTPDKKHVKESKKTTKKILTRKQLQILKKEIWDGFGLLLSINPYYGFELH